MPHIIYSILCCPSMKKYKQSICLLKKCFLLLLPIIIACLFGLQMLRYYRNTIRCNCRTNSTSYKFGGCQWLWITGKEVWGSAVILAKIPPLSNPLFDLIWIANHRNCWKNAVINPFFKWLTCEQRCLFWRLKLSDVDRVFGFLDLNKARNRSNYSRHCAYNCACAVHKSQVQ